MTNPERKDFHQNLAVYFSFKPLYLDRPGQKKPNIRKLVEQPWQQTKGKRWDAVTATLCSLEFIQAKSAAKMTFELVNDFNTVLGVIPENIENIHREKERQERIESYTRDLILFAKGKTGKLNILKSVRPWRDEQIASEIERMATNPDNADKLKVFLNFLGQEANNLNNHASELSGITVQQAWNNYNSGPVGEAAEQSDTDTLSKLILRIPSTRPTGNYLPIGIKILAGHAESVNSVDFTPDGKLAVSCSGIYHAGGPVSKDNSCVLWNLENGQPLKTFKGHTDSVLGIAITPDGKFMLSCSRDRTIMFWDLTSGQLKKTLKVHQNVVNTISITPDAKHAVSASDDHTCIFWDIEKGKPLKILKGHHIPVTVAVITFDAKFAVSAARNEIIFWNLQTGKHLKSFSGSAGYINDISVTSDGKLAVSGADDGVCILWDTQRGQLMKTFNEPDRFYPGRRERINAVSITNDGKYFLSVTDLNSFIIWDTQFGYPVRSFKGHSSDVIDGVIAPDGKFALSSSKDTTCILWDLECSQPQRKMTKEPSWGISAATVNIPDRKLIESDIKLEVQKLNPHLMYSRVRLNTTKSHWISANIVASDGTIIESCSEPLDTLTDQLELYVEIYGGRYNAKVAAISPDEIFGLLSMGNEDCILWDLVKDQPIRTLKGHTGKIYSVAISMDGKVGASASEDKTCILWDLETGNSLKTLTGHTGSVFGVAFTPDGKLIVTASRDGKVILWDLETREKTAQFFTNQHLDYFSLRRTGLVLRGQGRTYIEHHFLAMPDYYTRNGIKLTTLRQISDSETGQYQKPFADCPDCGQNFTPEESVLFKIDEIKKEAGLMKEESPCIELPKKAWDESDLITNCPECGERVKFNPFIVDHNVQYYSSVRRDEKFETFQLNRNPDSLRQEALKQYKFGRYMEAKRLLQLLLTVNYEVLSIHMHLARIALISDNVTEVYKHVREAWELRKNTVPYVLARILWFRLCLRFIEQGEREDIAVIIGQLKTVLLKEEAVMEWTMEPVLKYLKSKIAEKQYSLLKALVNALSFKDRTEQLNNFPEWREAKPQDPDYIQY